MPKIEILTELNFLSELFLDDAPEVRLLAEYPSSNSEDTRFQNKNRYIIHDPYPPPPRELLKTLGPHHLMCGWGHHLGVTSELAPPNALVDHWADYFGSEARPNWLPPSSTCEYITLFPHESLPAEQQVIDPEVNYALHSKEVIAKIACNQAEVLPEVTPPCIVKLSHGYAGLGNFLIQNETDERAMHNELAKHWPNATLIINSIIEDITGDYGVQFYLRKDGGIVWLGLTAQNFNEQNRWCGGTYSSHLQSDLIDQFSEIVEATASYLHDHGYFGVVGVDILCDSHGQSFLVDVNPRLTGVTPFMIASRLFDRDLGLKEGIYQASCVFPGSLKQLIDWVNQQSDAKVVVVSAFEDETDSKSTQTICHLSAHSNSQKINREVLNELLRA